MRIRVPSLTEVAPLSLVEKLRNVLARAQKDAADAPSAYQVSGEWVHLLRAIPKDVQSLQALLNTMFRQSAAIGFMASHSTRYLKSPLGLMKRRRILAGMASDLHIWRTLFHEPIATLEAPPIGSPWGVEVDNVLLYPTVCRADYFARQISMLVPTGGTVAEIGGGYGELAYRLWKLRPDIRYICFDLPEVQLYASYFLSLACRDASIALYEGRAVDTSIGTHNITLMPNYTLPELGHADVTVNTRSLSEMSPETVREYLRQISRFTRGYFLHENSNESLPTFGDHHEVPAWDFCVPGFRPLSMQKSAWSEGAGVAGRYVQCLYQLAPAQEME